MGDFALAPCERIEALPTTLCSRSTSHTKGTWVEVTAATSFAYEALHVTAMEDPTSGGADVFLVDIGVGASGSEIVIVPNILIDNNRAALGQVLVALNLPLAIPAGTRIAVRCQDSTGSGTRSTRIGLVGKAGGANYPVALCQSLVNYGALTASTNGTLVDSGATANTFGAWVQFTASTSARHNFLHPVIGYDKQTGGGSGAVANAEYQIAVGASGDEQIIGYGQVSFGGGGYGVISNGLPFYPQIPVGSRLSMRTKSASATAADRHITFVLLAG